MALLMYTKALNKVCCVGVHTETAHCKWTHAGSHLQIV